MKKIVTLMSLALLALMLAGCGEQPITPDDVVCSNAYWHIRRLNDSTLLMVPNTTDTIPIVKCITHDPDCPCHQNGPVDSECVEL